MDNNLAFHETASSFTPGQSIPHYAAEIKCISMSYINGLYLFLCFSMNALNEMVIDLYFDLDFK